jgi:hypothetical protein
MMPSEKKKPRIRFAHIFIAAAVLIILVHFTIAGFAPYFMALMPTFPFLLLSVLPISWKFVGHSDTHGMVGAGIGALASVLPVTVIFAYDMVTGWRGVLISGWAYSICFCHCIQSSLWPLATSSVETAACIRHRNFQRLPHIFKTVIICSSIG